ncbi:MAG TPA: sigma-54-dependent Fis family transcriptional regulator [Acidisarcina sp.]
MAAARTGMMELDFGGDQGRCGAGAQLPLEAQPPPREPGEDAVGSASRTAGRSAGSAHAQDWASEAATTLEGAAAGGAAAGAPAQRGAAGRSAADSGRASARPTHTAVLASSDLSLRRRVRETLGSRWELREAGGGAEALAHLNARTSDALLLDSWLPDLEIEEFIAEFRRLHPAVDLVFADETAGVRSLVRCPQRNELLQALRQGQDGERPSRSGTGYPGLFELHGSIAQQDDGVKGPAVLSPAALNRGVVYSTGLNPGRAGHRSSKLPDLTRAPDVFLEDEFTEAALAGNGSAGNGSAGNGSAASGSAGNGSRGGASQLERKRDGGAAAAESGVPPQGSPRSVSSPQAPARLPELVGVHPLMLEVSRRVRLVAPHSTPVLIQGATGTGKELVARALHRLSPRAAKPFVALNCAAIPEALLESELFGHARGAFTGAVGRRTGRIEAAQGGTLLLDEIGEMPLALQAKLLRFVECGELQRVGENDVVRVDVRIVAATHRPLGQLSRAGGFRSDLYYRLAVFLIRTPPLAAHREDIEALSGHFLRRMGGPVRSLTRPAMAKLQGHCWPGNIRELEHVLERASILAEEREEIGCAEIEFSDDPDEL